MATYSSHRLIMGNVELDSNFSSVSMGKLEMYIVISSMFHKIFIQIAEFDFLPGRGVKFREKKNTTKIFFSETIKWMKLILSIHAYDISLYIIVFYCGRIRTLVAMATYIFHRRLMGKVEIGCLNRDIWIFFYIKVY